MRNILRLSLWIKLVDTILCWYLSVPITVGGGTGGVEPPGSRPVFFGSRPFAFFRLQNIVQRCIIFPFFSRFPPPWESRFPPPLLPPPVHFPPPFLPVSRPLSPPHITVAIFSGFPNKKLFQFLGSTGSYILGFSPLSPKKTEFLFALSLLV